MNYGNLYHELNSLPKVPIGMQGTDIIESHWANWLASDDILQPEVTAKFIGYYRCIQRLPDRYIAKNTEQLHSQWLYRKYTQISEPETGLVKIDNTKMPDDAYQYDSIGNLVLKLKLDKSQHITEAAINGNLVPAYFEEEGFAFLYLPPLKKEKYILQYHTGSELMPLYVFNDGTYNVYELSRSVNQIRITLKMYGIQTVKVQCNNPVNVVSGTKGFNVERFGYLSDKGMLQITVQGTNMQGTCGVIKIQY
jgi:hypothetical protein